MFRKIDDGGRPRVTVVVDGVAEAAIAGEPAAAVLLRTPPFTSRLTPIGENPRAPFCMMGACFECLAEIDGASSTRSCLVPVRDGMVISRQTARPDPAGRAAR